MYGRISAKHLFIIFGCFTLIYLLIIFHEEHHLASKGSSKQSPVSQIMHLVRSLGLQLNLNTNPSKPVSVLLLTYMRSGSSLTGDILQHSPGAFYVYEPFRGLGHKNRSSFTITYVNGTQRKPPFSFQKETYDALYNIFTCNLNKLPNFVLTDPFIDKGIKSRMFRYCFRKYKELEDDKQNNTNALRMCVRQLEGICADSPFRIIKTIRLQLHDIKGLMEDLPELKIVHLVRDPRATLVSQASVGMCSAQRGGQIGCTNKFCKRLENDVLEEENLLRIYPNRIFPVFYEDIARKPLETSLTLYNFIGADFTMEAAKYIYNITLAGQSNNCGICTTRSNSSEHVDSWKKKMKPEFVQIVNERCNYIIKRYQFDEFPIKT